MAYKITSVWFLYSVIKSLYKYLVHKYVSSAEPAASTGTLLTIVWSEHWKNNIKSDIAQLKDSKKSSQLQEHTNSLLTLTLKSCKNLTCFAKRK